jgi:uncharacterized protein YsxB (DUF464 family)
MISARFFYVGSLCTGCTVSGHAGYGEAGEDIVCAAVSSAVQTVANLMTEVYALPIREKVSEKTAEISLQLAGTPVEGDDVQHLFRGLELQLSCLEEMYPAYIQMERKFH